MKMNNIDRAFFSVIKNFIIREENELKLMEKGIFNMPELALVYQIGKEIMNHKELIFENPNVKWRREEKLGKGGINDLAFDVTGKVNELFVFEFKMRDTRDMYEKDIRKLQSFIDDSRDKIHKYFCAVIDENKGEKSSDSPHRRMIHISNLPDVNIDLVGSHPFEDLSEETWYSEGIFPNICLWKILE